MAEKVKNMLKNNMVLCVMILAAIGFTSFVFAADFKVKAGALEEGVIFGEWMTEDSDNNDFVNLGIYQATSDGFVVASCYSSAGSTAQITAYTDSSSSAGTQRLKTTSEEDMHISYSCITLPVKQNDYWKLNIGSAAYTIYWIPLGNGSAPVKQ